MNIFFVVVLFLACQCVPEVQVELEYSGCIEAAAQGYLRGHVVTTPDKLAKICSDIYEEKKSLGRRKK